MEHSDVELSDAAGDGAASEPATDDRYRALAHLVRRRLLFAMLETPNGAVDGLAELLYGWAVTTGEKASYDQIRTALQHTHLTRLDAAGLAEFDRVSPPNAASGRPDGDVQHVELSNSSARRGRPIVPARRPTLRFTSTTLATGRRRRGYRSYRIPPRGRTRPVLVSRLRRWPGVDSSLCVTGQRGRDGLRRLLELRPLLRQPLGGHAGLSGFGVFYILDRICSDTVRPCGYRHRPPI